MKITLILWIVMVAAGMAAMLYVASNKTIVIADAAQEEFAGENDADSHAKEGTKLLFENRGGEKRSIRIPLPKGTKAENVVMENRYMERELWIYLQGAESSFYRENALYGDVQSVLQGYCEDNRDSIVLKLQMADVMEYRSTMENDTLTIACSEPGELYRFVVVIDPVGGGTDMGIVDEEYAEKNLALKVAKQLQRTYEQEGVKLYFTRLEDVNVSEEERLRLVEDVHADAFIRIGGSCDDREENYGIQSFYNEEYFIPGFGNVQLADALTRNVTIASSNRAEGLFPAGEDSILQKITVPAAQICLGYLSNPQENVLLRREDYQEKLAEGLADAITEVYTQIADSASE